MNILKINIYDAHSKCFHFASVFIIPSHVQQLSDYDNKLNKKCNPTIIFTNKYFVLFLNTYVDCFVSSMTKLNN